MLYGYRYSTCILYRRRSLLLRKGCIISLYDIMSVHKNDCMCNVYSNGIIFNAILSMREYHLPKYVILLQKKRIISQIWNVF